MAQVLRARRARIVSDRRLGDREVSEPLQVRLDSSGLEELLTFLLLLLENPSELRSSLELTVVEQVTQSYQNRNDTLPSSPQDRSFRLGSLLSDLLHVHLIGSICVAERPDPGPEACKGCILADSLGTVHLHGPVDDGEGHLGNDSLCLNR